MTYLKSYQNLVKLILGPQKYTCAAMPKKCGEWSYLFATIVANAKILFEIADLILKVIILYFTCNIDFYNVN
jgi:hypothetical protein